MFKILDKIKNQMKNLTTKIMLSVALSFLVVSGFSFIGVQDLKAYTCPDISGIYCGNCDETPTLYVDVCLPDCDELPGLVFLYGPHNTSNREVLYLDEMQVCQQGCRNYIGSTTYKVKGCLDWEIKCGDDIIASGTLKPCCELCPL
jgi:hypothetical protein